MTCIGEYNFCIKKGSNYVESFTFTVTETGSLYDLSAFDTAEMLVLDKRGGSSLFTSTGTINQGASKVTFTIAPSVTASLAVNYAFYNLKMSNSGDATVDEIFVEGVIEFVG